MQDEIYDETLKTVKDGIDLVKKASNEIEDIKRRHRENSKEKAAEKQHKAEQKKQELVLQQMTQFQQFIYFMSNTIIESTQPTKNTETETVLQNVPYEICKGCFRNKICWVQNHAEMTNLLQGWHSVKGMNQPVKLIQTEEQINRKCIKAKALIEEMEISTIEKRIESQYFHGKKMLAMQLHDFSAHLDKLINDMKHHYQLILQ